MTPTEQQKAILECRENLVVIAAPGSGKTFVLSEKIKNDIKELLDYQGIIAISYTNKASLELKNRSLANGISPKSSFFGTIDKFCIQDIIIPFGSLMQEKKTFDNLIIRSMNNSERSQLGQVEKREKIEYNHMDIILSLLEANIILIECIGILANYIFDNSKACRSYLKSRYKYLYVDEYQDTGIDQHYLFIKLKNMGIIMAAVGDVNQSIFEFSGKKSYYLKRIRQDKTFRSFILSQNHRSHQSIVNYSNRLIDSTCTITDIPEKDRRVFYFISLGDEKHIASFIDDTISLVISQNILVLLQRVGYFEYYILTCLNRITNSYYNVLSLLNTSMIRAQNSVLRSTNRNIRLLLYRRNVFIRLSSSNYIHIIFRNEFLLCCKISIYWDDYQRQYDDKHSSWRQYVSQHSLCP